MGCRTGGGENPPDCVCVCVEYRRHGEEVWSGGGSLSESIGMGGGRGYGNDGEWVCMLAGAEDTAGQQAHEDKPRRWSGRAGDGRSRVKQGALAAEGCIRQEHRRENTLL